MPLFWRGKKSAAESAAAAAAADDNAAGVSGATGGKKPLGSAYFPMAAFSPKGTRFVSSRLELCEFKQLGGINSFNHWGLRLVSTYVRLDNPDADPIVQSTFFHAIGARNGNDPAYIPIAEFDPMLSRSIAKIPPTVLVDDLTLLPEQMHLLACEVANDFVFKVATNNCQMFCTDIIELAAEKLPTVVTKEKIAQMNAAMKKANARPLMQRLKFKRNPLSAPEGLDPEMESASADYASAQPVADRYEGHYERDHRDQRPQPPGYYQQGGPQRPGFRPTYQQQQQQARREGGGIRPPGPMMGGFRGGPGNFGPGGGGGGGFMNQQQQQNAAASQQRRAESYSQAHEQWSNQQQSVQDYVAQQRAYAERQREATSGGSVRPPARVQSQGKGLRRPTNDRNTYI